MFKLRKIIRDYTPNYKALNTLDKQTKTVQDLYDQVSEFYRFLSDPAFRTEIKGEQGPQGLQGPQGEKGDTGTKGEKGDIGDTGPKGETGLQGTPGESSYQLAVDEGYQGTLEEFLNLIKEIYIGVGSTYSDIFIDDNKYENIKSPSTFDITTNNNKIIIIYPTNIYVSTPKLSGIDIPFVTSTFTENDVQYNVLTSVNNYNTNLVITI